MSLAGQHHRGFVIHPASSSPEIIKAPVAQTKRIII